MKLKIKQLEVKKDNRGWLSEIFSEKQIGQTKLGLILITTAYPSQTKGNHYHKRKREWYCVVKGRGLLKVWSTDGKEKEELEIGERNMVAVEIPRNYFHSITNIGDDELFLLAYVNESFNPKDPDTFYE